MIRCLWHTWYRAWWEVSPQQTPAIDWCSHTYRMGPVLGGCEAPLRKGKVGGKIGGNMISLLSETGNIHGFTSKCLNKQIKSLVIIKMRCFWLPVAWSWKPGLLSHLGQDGRGAYGHTFGRHPLPLVQGKLQILYPKLWCNLKLWRSYKLGSS